MVFLTTKIFEEKGMTATTKEINQDKKYIYNSSVVLNRLGGLKFPVDVLVHFENGEEKLEQWGGQERAFDFQYQGDHKIDWVQIDPEQKLYLDINFLNNSLRTKPEKKTVWKYVTEFMVKVQHALQGISIFA